MDKATRQMMNEEEQAMLRLVESKKFDKLDEDDLVDLHTRVRRARNKYSKLHRRQAAKRVGKHGSRAVATRAGRRTTAKAEVFEDALATVSRRLAKVAAASARALRDERLAAAEGVKSGKAAGKARGRAGASAGKAGGRHDKAQKKARTPDRKRRTASARAAGRRHQAKRDGR